MTTYEQQYGKNPQLKEGIDYWHLGDYVNARKCLSAALKTARANKDLVAAGGCSLYLGLLDLSSEQFDSARQRFQESCQIFQREESDLQLALALAGLGRAYDEHANVADAEGAYVAALQISVEKQAVPSLLLVLAGIALRLVRNVNQASTSQPEGIEQLRRAVALYTLALEQVENGEPADLDWFEAVFGQQIGLIVYELASDIVAEAQYNGRQLALWPTAVGLGAELKKLGWSDPLTHAEIALKDAPANPLFPEPSTNAFVEREERQKQLILLEKVQTAWVKGVLEPLEQSIQEAELIALGRLRLDTAVHTPWRGIIETDKVRVPVPPDESTLEIFLKADRALLILGEPGGGKTTTLIQLARDLINLARANPHQPIPVLMNLSTWAEARGDLADWIVEELTAKYQMPRQLGREWLDKNHLLLLLDGLDEMPSQAQPKCIAAINQFRQTHGLVGLAICCRRRDYEANEIRLQLGGAILIQPLSRSQIEAYLTAAGFQTAVLVNLFEQDKALWELTESPLMLGMMRQAFSQKESDLSHLLKDAVANPTRDIASRRRLFFRAFVNRMFDRRGGTALFSVEETKRMLTWLAQRMVEHNQSIFLIEQLQPSWLPDQKWRWGYLAISRAILGVSIGIITWFSALVTQQAGLDLTGGIYSWVASQLQVPFLVGMIVFLILLNLFLGLVVGLFDGFTYGRSREQLGFSVGGRRLYLRYLATVGLLVGVPTGIIFALFDQPLFAFFAGTLMAAFYMIEGAYSRQSLSFREDIQTVEVISWSNKDAVRSLLQYGLISSFIFGLLGSMIWGYFGFATGLNFALFFFLVGGMRRTQVETSNNSNQGVRLSLRNSLMAALIFGVVGGLLFMLLFNAATGLAAFALMALVAWFLYGGTVVLKHIGLRVLLWRAGSLPLKLRPFFQQVTDLIFMRRVGGGFMFTHHFLQEYFATLTPGEHTSSAGLTTKPTPKRETVISTPPKTQAQPPKPPAAQPERFIQEELIGTGTMGKVYRGKDTLTGQPVAIKQLRPYLINENPEAVMRFIREGEALQQLNHPNILSVLNVVNEKDRYVIVTEYLPGSLRDLLAEQPQLPVQQTVAIGLELADALARAHHLNIIHRDVKPENILLAADGTPRLADFGVAHLGQHATRLTEEGGFMGTPLYLSPETCVGQPASPLSDIWSFGIVLYEMLAGRPPFVKQQVLATMLTIVNDPVPDLTQFRPNVPDSLVNLLDQMLAKDPERRMGRMRQVAAELEKIYETVR